jgi:uncharacterized protein YbjT (DUF2867 family)
VTDAAANTENGASGRGRIVTVLGGTGFLGHRVARHLLDRGFRVRAAARHPERTPSLLGPDEVELEAIGADVHDEASVAAAVAGAYGVVNALSLYIERGSRETFRVVHVEAAARVARLARKAGVGRLVHVSGIGADPASSSDYIHARGEGEIVVQEAFPGATLPSRCGRLSPSCLSLCPAPRSRAARSRLCGATTWLPWNCPACGTCT